MQVLKVVGVIALGLVGLAILLYLIGVGVNWRDQPPSAAALEMKTLHAEHAPVDDRDNGYIYVMGFLAPASADPQAAGALRRDWVETVNRDPKQSDADPVKESVDFVASMSRAMERVKSDCAQHSVACRDSFLTARSGPRLALEELQLTRYRALLQRKTWFETVPLDPSTPLPAYGDVIHGQRLFFVDLAARAKSAPPGEVAAALRDDLAFWREASKSAGYLITRMISVAALRQHFFFGNLVMREMPCARDEVIDVWSVPFGADELSMRRTMAGELAFAEGVILTWKNGGAEHFTEPYGEGLSLPGRIGSSLARPYYQHQDQTNYYAAAYLDFAKRFEAPLDQYAEIAGSIEASESRANSFHVYNAVGHVFRSLNGMSRFANYPVRVASIEGMRRAALLTAELRERGVPHAELVGEVGGAELRNPFDGKPFEWSAEEQAVVYVGPEAEGSRRRHPYFY